MKIRDQHFHFAAGNALANGLDGEGEELGAAILAIVTIDAGDHGVLESKDGAGFGDAARFVVIDGEGRAFLDGAKSAAAGADIAEDHESCGAAIPALAGVGAGGAFADGVQFQVVDQAFQLAIILAGGRGGAEPGGAGGLGVDGDEHYFYFAGRS